MNEPKNNMDKMDQIVRIWKFVHSKESQVAKETYDIVYENELLHGLSHTGSPFFLPFLTIASPLFSKMTSINKEFTDDTTFNISQSALRKT